MKIDCSHRFYVYRHTRDDNNQTFYIGIGSGNRCLSKDRNIFWKNVVAKTSYTIDILFTSNNYELIKQREIDYIKFYGRRDINTGTLVNLTDGGQGMLNYKITEDHRRALKDNSANNKAIICIKTGKVYKSISEAAYYENIKVNTLQYQLLRNSKRKFAYLNQAFVVENNLKKKVIHTVTGQIFNSIKEAATELNMNYHTARSWLSENKKVSTLKYI